jgi:DNA replication protein DnaC
MNDIRTTTDEVVLQLSRVAQNFNQAEYDARRAEEIRRQDRIRTENLRREWNAPRRHIENRSKIVHAGPWLETKTKVLERIGTGFLIGLIGTRGNGKTQLAIEAMFEATSRGLSARYLSAMEFFLAIKSSYAPASPETEDMVLKRLAKIRLLVIDELAKRGESDWENRLLFELIDRRYRNMFDTVVIANQSASEFNASVGPSMADRMNESGGIIECTWESFRK